MQVLSVKKVRGSEPLTYMFWLHDQAKAHQRGYLGRMEFASEETLREMLTTRGNLSPVQADDALREIDWDVPFVVNREEA